MESIDIDMDDMFETADVDDDDAVVQINEDQHAGEDGANEVDENGDLQSQMVRRLRDMSAGAAKKIVKKPQPKLDAERLNSDRGFPALRKIFEDVKFKGKGHEVGDFLLMMRSLEHWAHRLFPKMTFDEVIERCERLGKKSQVKTVLRKIRLGMAVLDDEFVEQEVDHNRNIRDDDDDDDDERHQAPEEAADLDEMMRDVDGDLVDDFVNTMSSAVDAGSVTTSGSQPTVAHTSASPGSQPTVAVIASPAGSVDASQTLNQDQIARIERNQRLAIERRKAKMAAQSGGTPSAKRLKYSTIDIRAGSDPERTSCDTVEGQIDVHDNFTESITPELDVTFDGSDVR